MSALEQKKAPGGEVLQRNYQTRKAERVFASPPWCGRVLALGLELHALDDDLGAGGHLAELLRQMGLFRGGRLGRLASDDLHFLGALTTTAKFAGAFGRGAHGVLLTV